MGKLELQTPVMIHFGEEPYDEVFITAEAAAGGIEIENTGYEPLVSLRYFGPNVHIRRHRRSATTASSRSPGLPSVHVERDAKSALRDDKSIVVRGVSPTAYEFVLEAVGDCHVRYQRASSKSWPVAESCPTPRGMQSHWW